MKKKIIVAFAVLVISACFNSIAKAVQFYDTIGTPYEGAVERLSELGIVSGVSKNVYNPERTVTRAEFAKIMVESSFRKSEFNALVFDDANVNFKDVDKNDWYYKYVVVAYNGGLMKGYEDGTFRPDREISYSEISKMVTKALGHDYLVTTDPRGWDAEFVDKMFEYNLFDSTRGITDMSDKATRGNVASIVWNMLKTDTWEMIYRNDTAGFSYVNSGISLLAKKVKNYGFISKGVVTGYAEFSGNMYAIINGSAYKLYNQDDAVYFSTIGGTTDVLLKRVEYPGRDVRMEIVGISTDLGSKAVEGSYEQLKEEGYDLSNKVKLSENSDYYYAYTNEYDPSRDRVVGINMENIILVDEIKIDDSEPEKDSNEEEDLSHSEVPGDFEDDVIAERKQSKDSTFIRTININNDDMIIQPGAVLFKNNKRVSWSSVQKGDILAEITPNRYYFVIDAVPKTVRLLDYNTKKGESSITTSSGTFTTYFSTKYFDYIGNDVQRFNGLKASELANLKNRNIDIYLDSAGRVVKISVLEDDVTMEEMNIGVFESIIYGQKDKEYNEITLFMDGKRKEFNTTAKQSKIENGELVQIKFDEKKPRIVSSMNTLNDGTTITGNITAKKYKFSELEKKIKYYDEDKINILRIKYHYEFGQYDGAKSYDIDYLTLRDFVSYDDEDDLVIFGLVDVNGGIVQVFIQDYTERLSKYYGIVERAFREEGTQYINVQVVGEKKAHLYKTDRPINCERGDFICFKADGKENIIVGEKYTPSIMGYFKDLEVLSINQEKKETISYDISDNGLLDIASWTLKTPNEDYDLNKFDIILINTSKNEKKDVYQFDNATLVTQKKISLLEGDMIAINEIEGAIVIYRGYEG